MIRENVQNILYIHSSGQVKSSSPHGMYINTIVGGTDALKRFQRAKEIEGRE